MSNLNKRIEDLEQRTEAEEEPLTFFVTSVEDIAELTDADKERLIAEYKAKHPDDHGIRFIMPKLNDAGEWVLRE